MSTPALDDLVDIVFAHNWGDIVRFQESILGSGQWLFRGQSNLLWPLRSSLDRALDEYSVPASDARDVERGLIRRYQRQGHQYLPDMRAPANVLEWMALMQHHGAPTRVLDWSYSFFVALYFAVEAQDACGSTVWAINSDRLEGPFSQALRSDPKLLVVWQKDKAILKSSTFRQVFLGTSPIRLVGSVTPKRMNARLVIQQGTFLCPGDVAAPFHANLAAMLSPMDTRLIRDNFKRLNIQIDISDRREVLLRLHRMNMNRATLFPGLGGFSESMKPMIANYEVLLRPAPEERP